jgi:hypothetical protein
MTQSSISRIFVMGRSWVAPPEKVRAALGVLHGAGSVGLGSEFFALAAVRIFEHLFLSVRGTPRRSISAKRVSGRLT